ncbi:AAA family ATPase [Rummeliibacillus sp. NPDC094406]|uniref:AAA family ATPase n=1 Tax=Rummeliibacillus sp. NPDC094406 TaxID=3364511 RepID=UPI00380A355A
MYFIQMSGFPGSGKSTLAKAIASNENMIIVDHDIVKSALINSIAEKAIDFQITGQIAYEVDWALIEFYLSQGRSVILDSPCLYEEQVEKGVELALRFNVKYKYIECYIDDYNLINDRLAKRERLISQIPQIHSKEAFEYTIQNGEKPENLEILKIDTNQTLSNYFPLVIEYILK